MRTFHTGGIVGLDITQGLHRVEELFEARTPKFAAKITEITGKVKIEESEGGYVVHVKSTNLRPPIEKEYFIPPTSELTVVDGQLTTAGTPLSSGYQDVKEILAISALALKVHLQMENLELLMQLREMLISMPTLLQPNYRTLRVADGLLI